jgi:hypothetical protein
MQHTKKADHRFLGIQDSAVGRPRQVRHYIYENGPIYPYSSLQALESYTQYRKNRVEMQHTKKADHRFLGIQDIPAMIEGINDVALSQRVSTWIETVPRLLAHLDIQHVSLASHSAVRYELVSCYTEPRFTYRSTTKTRTPHFSAIVCRQSQRVSTWIETVPRLLAHLDIQHVSLASHSAGTIYLYDMSLLHVILSLGSPTDQQPKRARPISRRLCADRRCRSEFPPGSRPSHGFWHI